MQRSFTTSGFSGLLPRNNGHYIRAVSALTVAPFRVPSYYLLAHFQAYSLATQHPWVAVCGLTASDPPNQFAGLALSAVILAKAAFPAEHSYYATRDDAFTVVQTHDPCPVNSQTQTLIKAPTYACIRIPHTSRYMRLDEYSSQTLALKMSPGARNARVVSSV
ncbi:hypothetical protein METBIDRAFT_12332 [Metschnikowia bicuspidata var. bicuspidata NRRL YB-4993]|uniref:Uncharacterized protein n=1 Tax=Metschnikowia bicuspidata var. bicuspidata NRRL YB-4993 TaxID=869754 RepID=A0A1A0H861_9ASCO|nr:hypothetical protein METBIDRAFT_12332 [Metschnikowia bicuspidata var. bicuspidata NRRL YB-4993]OBA20294.1 hypothetical protein METBIDRAFT_12332 [Metschnikowia bicuspidata var. bicuspidata NRRL YB-4993]